MKRLLAAPACLASGMPGQRVAVAAARVSGRPRPAAPLDPCRICRDERAGTLDADSASGLCGTCLHDTTLVGVSARRRDAEMLSGTPLTTPKPPPCAPGRRRHRWSPEVSVGLGGAERSCHECGCRMMITGSRKLFASAADLAAADTNKEEDHVSQP